MSAMNYLLLSTLVCLALAHIDSTEGNECTITEQSVVEKLCELDSKLNRLSIFMKFLDAQLVHHHPLGTTRDDLDAMVAASDAAPMQKRKNEFIRFGKRKNEFIRFGRSNGGAEGADEQFVAKRKNEFIRFG